jgi:hypothetical protein
MWELETSVEHPATNLIKCCQYWQAHPKVRTSISLWQTISRIVKQAQTADLELARLEYSRFMQTMSIEEWQAYEQHFEDEERRALLPDG